MKYKLKEIMLRTLGFTFFMLGMAGLAGACEGQGSFFLSMTALVVGIFLGWIDMKCFE